MMNDVGYQRLLSLMRLAVTTDYTLVATNLLPWKMHHYIGSPVHLSLKKNAILSFQVSLLSLRLLQAFCLRIVIAQVQMISNYNSRTQAYNIIMFSVHHVILYIL